MSTKIYNAYIFNGTPDEVVPFLSNLSNNLGKDLFKSRVELAYKFNDIEGDKYKELNK